MIPQDTVNQIIQTTDIVEVISEFVNLKKRGANMMACCPFHNEKTPSFSVSPSKGIYKCFGCGKGGDAIRFLMDLEGMSYPEALRWLAKKYNIEVKERKLTDDELQAQNERESLFIVTEFAEEYFHKNLTESEEGQSIGLSYFNERGFSKAVIDKFKLGYALNGRDDLYKLAVQSGFSADILEKAGLISVREGPVYNDRFWGRVVFPIHNLAGKPIAFGARILRSDTKAPKYVNSPETEIYHKSRIVYGIHQARGAIRQQENCYLVEGYADVISLHQGGIENVVATSGTSLTPEQIKLIGRFTDNITVLFDGDKAGIAASLRSIDLILEEDLNVKAVIFPDGDDPDNYIRKVGSDAFQKYIEEHQKDFIQFKTEIALEDVGDDAIKKAELIQSLVESISKIPQPLKRQLFYQQVAGMLNVDEHILINEGNKLIASKIKTRTGPRERAAVRPLPPQRDLESEFLERDQSSDEEALVKDLLLYGHLPIGTGSDETNIVADFIFNEIESEMINNPVLRAIYKEYNTFYSRSETIPPNYFISNPNTQIQDYAVKWASVRDEVSEGWTKYEVYVPKYEEKLGEIISKIVFRIYLLQITEEIDGLLERMETDDEDEQDIIMNAIEEKVATKKLIAKELGATL